MLTFFIDDLEICGERGPWFCEIYVPKNVLSRMLKMIQENNMNNVSVEINWANGFHSGDRWGMIDYGGRSNTFRGEIVSMIF